MQIERKDQLEVGEIYYAVRPWPECVKEWIFLGQCTFGKDGSLAAIATFPISFYNDGRLRDRVLLRSDGEFQKCFDLGLFDDHNEAVLASCENAKAEMLDELGAVMSQIKEIEAEGVNDGAA